MSRYSNHFAADNQPDDDFDFDAPETSTECNDREFDQFDEDNYAEYLALQALLSLPADARQRVIQQAEQLNNAAGKEIDGDPPF